MPSVTVRLYEELNEFLPADRRRRPFPVDVPPGSTTKAVIENLGVPHTEIDLVLVNGESVGFLPPARATATSSACTPCSSPGTSQRCPACAAVPLRETRFVADVHLGKLARLLRMIGFDTACGERPGRRGDRAGCAEGEADHPEQGPGAAEEARCHARLPASGPSPRASSSPRCSRRFDLARQVQLFGRCMSCNAPLARVSRLSVLDALPPAVAETCTEFSRCPGAGRSSGEGATGRA